MCHIYIYICILAAFYVLVHVLYISLTKFKLRVEGLGKRGREINLLTFIM